MRIHRILIGTEFSEASAHAARWAMEHLAPSAEVILAHVIDARDEHGAVIAREPAGELMSEARARLTRFAEAIGVAGARVELRTGRPHEQLALLAERVGADVIVIGPHGDHPARPAALGTTAERLVRIAAPATLVVPPRAGSIRRIVAALDDGPATDAVLEWALATADAARARLMLIHVLDDRERSRGGIVSRESANANARTVPDALAWLRALGQTLGDSRHVETVVTTGSPGDEILTAAREVDAGLIVLGRRGRRSPTVALPWSTLRAVLEGAHCPVLVIAERGVDWSADAGEMAETELTDA